MSGKNSRIGGASAAARLFVRTAAAALAPGLPPYLIFFVTHRCNGRCPFCFDRNRAAPGADELRLSEIEKIAANWNGILQVTLTGGEPFLRDDLADVAHAWVKAGAASLTIATNGTLTQLIVPAVSALLAQCPNLALDLNISLDGPPELHDRLRGIAGAHQAALATARALAPLQDRHPGFRVGATLTVSGFNRDSAVETIKDLQASGLFRRVQAVWVRGRPYDPAALDCDPGVYRQCVKVLETPGPGRGVARVKAALSGMVRETVARTIRDDRLARPCRAGASMVEMDAAGRVYPCEVLGQLRPEGAPDAGIDSWEMGSLRDNDYRIAKIMGSPRARTIAAWVRQSGCYCSFECAAYNNIVFSPASWPGVLRRIWRS